jgi:hypothetical protein
MEGVEVLRFTEAEFEQWWAENNIQRHGNKYTIGYNRVVQELYIEHSKLMGVDKRFIIEDFEGYRYIIYKEILQDILEDENSYDVGQVVNARLIRDAGYNHSKIILCNRISDFEYRPSYRSMLFYLKVSHLISFEVEDVHVKQTHMTQQEFNGLIAKLKMTAHKFMLVDYNTIGVFDSPTNLLIYTRQSGIKKNKLRFV